MQIEMDGTMTKKQIYLCCMVVFGFFYAIIKSYLDDRTFIFVAISYILASRLLAEKLGKKQDD